MTNMEIFSVLAAFLTALTGIAVGLKTRNKIQADSTKTLTDVALSLVEPLKKQIDDMEKEMGECKTELRILYCEVDTLKRENEKFKAGISLLMNQLKANGLNPIWHPEEGK